MSRITREEVERIAALARLSLSDAEAARMTADLEAILGYVEQLQQLDTSDVEPTAHPLSVPTPLREDSVVPSFEAALALANAPASEDFAFLVPKVIEGEGG